MKSTGTSGMTLLRLEQEIWISQFGERLVRVQPECPDAIAKEVAMNMWPHLGLMPPVHAVEILLDWALQARSVGGGLPSFSD